MSKPTHITQFRRGWRYQRGVPRRFRSLVGRSNWTHVLGRVGEPFALREAARYNVYYDGVIARLAALQPDEVSAMQAAGGLIALFERVKGRKWHDAMTLRILEQPSAPPPLNREGLPPALVNMSPAVLRRLEEKAALSALKLRRKLVAEAPETGALIASIDALFPPRSSTRLDSLIDKWEEVAAPRSPRTTKRMRLCVRRFVALVGEMPPRSVTRQNAIVFRDALAKDPRITKSAQKHLHAMSRLFNVGLSEGLVESNPFHGIKARRPPGQKLSSAKARKAFEGAQARAILKAIDELNLTEPRWRDFRHIFRLMIFHGCRSGEAVNLTPSDVTKVGKIIVLRFHDEEPGASIKSASSLREVPLHPSCKDLMRHVETARKFKQQWLFESLPNWTAGRAGKFQQLASVFLRKNAGIQDPKVTAHSSRHYWRWLANEIDMPSAVSRSLIGHSLGKDHHDGTYGSVPSLKKRYEWLSKIDPVAG